MKNTKFQTFFDTNYQHPSWIPVENQLRRKDFFLLGFLLCSFRGRFLIGYGYLVILPLLLWIWQSVLGVAAPASWWASPWPALILAGVFFVLEAVTLVASSGERHGLPAVKDALFVVLYAVLLIVTVKST